MSAAPTAAPDVDVDLDAVPPCEGVVGDADNPQACPRAAAFSARLIHLDTNDTCDGPMLVCLRHLAVTFEWERLVAHRRCEAHGRNAKTKAVPL